jgi:5,10-methylenetetrahydromethanopterin reductase
VREKRRVTARPAYSCAFPPSKDVVDYARIAQELGFQCIWIYDSPALYGDQWVALARIAEQVPDIGLATGVAVPSMRHPMVTASAIATIEELSPGRLEVFFGTGFTARLSMGQRGGSWAGLAEYVKQVRGLLAGEVVVIEGKKCRMLHSPGFAPPRPIDVPIGLAPVGPKGFSVSRELTDRVILTGIPAVEQAGWARTAILVNGTVLDPGEDAGSKRVIEAAGPAYATSAHAFWEWAPDLLDTIPGGAAWRDRIRSEWPEDEWHLPVHEGHLVEIKELDRPLVDAAGERILVTGWTGTAAEVGARLDEAGAAGVSEVVWCPAGPDIPRELSAIAAAST